MKQQQTFKTEDFFLHRRKFSLAFLAWLSSCGKDFGEGWRLVRVSHEHQVLSIGTSGWEEVLTDWPFEFRDGAMSRHVNVVGTSVNGTELLLRQWCQDLSSGWVPEVTSKCSQLLRFSLLSGHMTAVQYPLGMSQDSLTGVPGMGLIVVAIVPRDRYPYNPDHALLCVREETEGHENWRVWNEKQSLWMRFEGVINPDVYAKDRKHAPVWSRLSVTGRRGEVIYSVDGVVYLHNLESSGRRRLLDGSYPSILRGEIISWLTLEGDLQIAQYPSMKPIRTIQGPFRDRVLWCPNGKWGVAVRRGDQRFLGTMATDELVLMTDDGAKEQSLGAYRRQIGTASLRWINCSGSALRHIHDLPRIVGAL